MAIENPYLLGCERVTYTATASSAATDQPATNVALVSKPKRRWKANATGTGEYLQLDLGATPPALVGLFLDRVDAATVLVQESDSAGSGYSTLTTLTINQDKRVGNRRKGYFVLPTTKRYHRLSAATFPSGLDTFAIGTAHLQAAAGLETMTQNPGRPTWQTLWPKTEVRDETQQLLGVNDEGDPRIVYNLSSDTWVNSRGAFDQVLRAANVGPAGTIMLFENFGQSQHAYLLHPVELGEVARHGFVEPGSLRLEEW